MRTKNNTTNTIEAIVAKYCNYVKAHTPKEQILEGDNSIVEWPIDMNDASASIQLMITLYNDIAGSNAKPEVQIILSEFADHFYKNVLEPEEYDFLSHHFEEVVSHVLTMHQDWLMGWNEFLTSSPHRLQLIQKKLQIESDSTLFIANCGVDTAFLFPKCVVQGYIGSEEDPITWALGKICLFAYNLEENIQSPMFYENIGYKVDLPSNGSMDYVIVGTTEHSTYDDILSLYELLSPTGKMLYFAHISDMAGSEEKFQKIRERLIKDNAISSIVLFEDEDFGIKQKYILLEIEKSKHKEVMLESIPDNKTAKILVSELDKDILWPGFYLTERPKDGVPLSNIVDIVVFNRKDGVSQDQLVVSASDFEDCFEDADIKLKKLLKVSDYDYIRRRMLRTVKQPCVFFYGDKDRIGVCYSTDIPAKGYAIHYNVSCLIPKKGIDIRYVAALLLMPEVYKQIIGICHGKASYGLVSRILNKILVPKHKLAERNLFLAEHCYSAMKSVQARLSQGHDDYIKAVRMRKHALTQSLSAIESMFYALNAYRERQDGNISDNGIISRVRKITVNEAFDFISKNLKEMMPTLEHIADVDYSFSKCEWIDPEKFIEGFVAENAQGWINFKPQVSWEHGNNQAKQDLKDPNSGVVVLKKGDTLNSLFFPKDALKRVFANIVSNAQEHGFTDKERKDYQLRFSWHTKGPAIVLEIENNGTPIPEDRDTDSLLEYGVSSVLHQNGHNGIGCNEIDDIMRRYGGRVKIESLPRNFFTVKYILTFERTNTIGTINL